MKTQLPLASYMVPAGPSLPSEHLMMHDTFTVFYKQSQVSQAQDTIQKMERVITSHFSTAEQRRKALDIIAKANQLLDQLRSL